MFSSSAGLNLTDQQQHACQPSRYRAHRALHYFIPMSLLVPAFELITNSPLLFCSHSRRRWLFSGKRAVCLKDGRLLLPKKGCIASIKFVAFFLFLFFIFFFFRRAHVSLLATSGFRFFVLFRPGPIGLLRSCRMNLLVDEHGFNMKLESREMSSVGPAELLAIVWAWGTPAHGGYGAEKKSVQRYRQVL